MILLGIYILLTIRARNPGTVGPGNPTVNITQTPVPTGPPITLIPVTGFVNSSEAYDPAFFEFEREQELTNTPDVTVKNNTPYENEDIFVYTEFVKEGGYFKVWVETKSGRSLSQAKSSFERWLLTLGIPKESFTKLHVEYKDGYRAPN